MRTRAVLGGTFASVAVLVLGWQVGTVTTAQPVASAAVATATSPDTGTDATTVPDAAVPDAATPDVATPDTTVPDTTVPDTTVPDTAPSTGAQDGTFVGSVESTRFGNMQVQVTIAGGAITDVVALQVTDNDRRSLEISNRAVPVLRSEVLAAQSAAVATVGGATYTSDGYLSSLQSALDSAGF